MVELKANLTIGGMTMWKDPEIYQDKAKEYRWRIESDNGEIVAASTEGYKNKSEAEKNLDSISMAVATSVLGLRPIVISFAIEMERKLQANDKKKGETGWLIDSPTTLLVKLMEEVGEIAELSLRSTMSPDEVRGECADVGNMAMMVADRVAGFPRIKQ